MSFQIGPVDACTRVMWNGGGTGVLVGRTMDWPESTHPILTVLPRGLSHDGGLLAGNLSKAPMRRSGLPNTVVWSRQSMDWAPLTGNVNSRDRFQRASYYLSMFPEPKQQREGVAGMFAIARNVSVPFGAPYKGFGVYNTEYRTVTDPTNKFYFFELTTSPSVIWTDMSKLDFSAGAPVRTLNPDNIGLNGEVSQAYTTAAAPY